MMTLLKRLNPAVPSGVLPVLAGTVWGLVGAMLWVRAVGWLTTATLPSGALAVAAGLVLGTVMIRTSFIPLVRKNLLRLAQRPPRACLFSMFAWRSWAIAVVMSVGGVLVRHSDAPRLPLAAMYVGMGLSLLGGSYLYFRSLGRRHD